MHQGDPTIEKSRTNEQNAYSDAPNMQNGIFNFK